MNTNSTISTELPLVTIGLPVFNGKATLAAALETLVGQSYPNLQIIISDNASTDATLEICEELARRDSRVRIIRKQVNEGAVANFRTVLDAAEGEFFMWAADDDFWNPQFISRLLPQLQAAPTAGVAMCAIDMRYPDGSPYGLTRFIGNQNPNEMGHLQLLRKILSGAKYNLFIYGLFRTTLLQRAMDQFPDVLGGDRQFICQMALACRFIYLDEVLLTRTHQPKHANAYITAMASRGTLRMQLVSFALMILRSNVIPWWRKAVLPAATIRYFMFGLRQKYSMSGTIIGKIARRLFLPPRVLAILGAALGIQLVIGWYLVTLRLISPELAIAILTQTLFVGLSTLLIRRWIMRSDQINLARHFGTDQEINRIAIGLRYLRDKVSLELTSQAANNLPPEPFVARFDKHHGTMKLVSAPDKSRITAVGLQELFPGIESELPEIEGVNLFASRVITSSILHASAVAKYVSAKKIFEFGTYMGGTTFCLAHNNPDGQVVTLDISPERDPRYAPFVGLLFRGYAEEKRITRIRSDCCEFDSTPYLHQFDFVLIDGSNRFDLVKQESQKAFDLLKPGGTIVWSDCVLNLARLVRFLQEFTEARPFFHVSSSGLLVYADNLGEGFPIRKL